MQYELNIGYFYPELLNLYGDRGNIITLVQRSRWRGIGVRVTEYSLKDTFPSAAESQYPNIVFMGGGPDSAQLLVAEDLARRQEWFLEYARRGGVGLFICGAYQLMGHYYQDADGQKLAGVGLFDLYTRHFGPDKPRCIGNVVVALSPSLKSAVASLAPSPYSLTPRLVGFENHGGRTYLGQEVTPLGQVERGYGNNGEDGSEGAVFHHCFGTYLHGPLLPKNPHLTDLLLLKALRKKYLEAVLLSPLDDTLEWQAHAAAQRLS
jgi:CobQ-like glutamine amidotransferase family enzyme